MQGENPCALKIELRPPPAAREAVAEAPAAAPPEAEAPPNDLD